MKQPYNTALYYRLSRDDENFGDSVSIETQKTILQQFARDNQFHVVDEYIDDGWSGTNFDRPAFQRMIDDVDAGRIAAGEASIEAVGKEIFNRILAAASGEQETWAQKWKLYNDLCLFNPAPVT